MSERPENLARLQAWLQQAIAAPHGILTGTSDAEIAEQILPSQRQTAVERLTIYHQAYFARLVECLREMFPASVALLGDESFAAIAVAYLDEHPSQSYTLNQLADRFVPFLQATRPPRDEDDALDWADFLVDLATLEQTIETIFDGPGDEDSPPLSPDKLGQLSPAQIADSRIILAQSLQLLTLRFPINDYFSAYREGNDPELPPPEPTWLAVYRRDYIVRRESLSQSQYDLLVALQQMPLLAAVEQSQITAEDLFAWFRDWSNCGIIRDVIPPSSL